MPASKPAFSLLVVGGLLALFCTGLAAAADYYLQPIRTISISPTDAFVDAKLVDYDRDGYDDIVYISKGQLTVYSCEADSNLLEVSATGLIGGLVADINADSLPDAILLTRRDSLIVQLYGSGVAETKRALPIVYWIWSEGPKDLPADLALADVNNDGMLELVVARSAECWRIQCGASMEYADAGWLFTFALPTFTNMEYFDQSHCYPPIWSDEHLRIGDLDGDGLNETITFGFRSQWLCSWETESGIPHELNEQDITIYNQLGQRIAGFVQDYGLQVAVGDLDPALPGEELIFSGPRNLAGEETPIGWPGRFVYAMNLDNGTIELRWSQAAEESVQRLMIHPALPFAVAVEYPSENRWRILNGSDGVKLGDIYGLAPNRTSMGGHFTSAADTGLQIVQLTNDGIVLYGTAVPTDIDDDIPAELPEAFALYPNYPNPFNPSTEIAFAIPRAGTVSLEIFNIAGRRVAVPLQEYLAAGEHRIEWDATGLASGVYLYRLTMGDFSQTRKMMLLK